MKIGEQPPRRKTVRRSKGAVCRTHGTRLFSVDVGAYPTPSAVTSEGVVDADTGAPAVEVAAQVTEGTDVSVRLGEVLIETLAAHRIGGTRVD